MDKDDEDPSGGDVDGGGPPPPPDSLFEDEEDHVVPPERDVPPPENPKPERVGVLTTKEQPNDPDHDPASCPDPDAKPDLPDPDAKLDNWLLNNMAVTVMNQLRAENSATLPAASKVVGKKKKDKKRLARTMPAGFRAGNKLSKLTPRRKQQLEKAKERMRFLLGKKLRCEAEAQEMRELLLKIIKVGS